MKTISTEITINASIEKVWKILTDFHAYPDWNPFVIQINGDLEIGKQLNVTLKIEGRKEMSIKPRLISVNQGESFCWLGSLVVKGIFDGKHCFVLKETQDKKTHLSHGETFTGLFAGLIIKNIRTATENGFEQMNRALKEKAED